MSVVSGTIGALTQKSAAKSAASSATSQAQIAAQTQKEMLDKVLAMQQPFANLGYSAIPQFTGAVGGGTPTGGNIPFTGVSPSAGLLEEKQKLVDYPELNLPTLNLDPFNYTFNAEHPTYLARKKELENTINTAAAARGNWNSRPTLNTLAEENIKLTGEESASQFGRALDTYNANISTALQNYGAGYQRSTDLYNTGYGKLTDLYNMTGNISALDYSKVLDALKIGAGAAGSAGQSTMATGQGLANTYGQLGQNLMNTDLASGQAMSDLWGGIGQTTGTIGGLALLKHYGLLGA